MRTENPAQQINWEWVKQKEQILAAQRPFLFNSCSVCFFPLYFIVIIIFLKHKLGFCLKHCQGLQMTSEYIKLSASSLPRSQQHQKHVKICRPRAETEEIICINEINKGSYSGYSMMGINWSISMATGQTSPADEHHEMWLKALKIVFRFSFENGSLHLHSRYLFWCDLNVGFQSCDLLLLTWLSCFWSHTHSTGHSRNSFMWQKIQY